MLLGKNALQLLTYLPFAGRRIAPSRHSNERGRRQAGRRIGRPDATCAAELLEDRLLLSAQTALPTFELLAHEPRGFSPLSGQGNGGPLTPAQMQTAYGVSGITFNGTAGNGAGQTIAIVDAYNDPTISTDANTFSSEFGLPLFNSAGGPTFRVLNENGGTSLPSNASAGTWDVEESLDVEWVHSIAPGANIILYEANSNSNADLYQAVATAADASGVSVVSMSFGSGEYSGETSTDSTFVTPNGHQGVTFLASSGDNGTPAGYPAFSPNVVAVGGTSLYVDASGNYQSESAWSGSGGGISQLESQPSYQTGNVNGTSSTRRTVPDVSMEADPNTGVYVLDSYNGGWMEVGGTSLSCPMWAGLIGIADQGRVANSETTLDGPSQTLPTLYSLPSSDFHDVTTGNNGTYSATTGYDLVTGRGTPIASLVISGLVGQENGGGNGNGGSSSSPSFSTPASGTLSGTSVTFSTTNGNAINVSDPSSGTEQLTLTATQGTLMLANTTGLTFTAGSYAAPSMTVQGSLSNIQSDLNGLRFTAASGFPGVGAIAFSMTNMSDGYTGTGHVTVTGNPTPLITSPSSVTVTASAPVVFSPSRGNGITVTDGYAGSTTEQITLACSPGVLTLATTSGLSIVTGTNRSASMTVQGSLASINAALNGLTFTPPLGFQGSGSIRILYKDLGDNLSYSDIMTLGNSNAAILGKHVNPPKSPITGVHIQVNSAPPTIEGLWPAGSGAADFAAPTQTSDASTEWAGFAAALEWLNLA
jgi:hypothetical protein